MFEEQISVRTNKYSIPVWFIDRQVGVLVHGSELIVYDGHTEITRHGRLLPIGETRLEPERFAAQTRSPAQRDDTLTGGRRRQVHAAETYQRKSSTTISLDYRVVCGSMAR
ncbi:hypothetical protein AB4305_33185 [Nocardia sp. 2YAB30]|uniref:Mu transposase domain-containing protein n=1 Tax=Nocardia sp. 2YAB30 TaxID=3233022 RepID=UPI003F9DDB89